MGKVEYSISFMANKEKKNDTVRAKEGRNSYPFSSEQNILYIFCGYPHSGSAGIIKFREEDPLWIRKN